MEKLEDRDRDRIEREYDLPRERHQSIEKADVDLIVKDIALNLDLLDDDSPIGKRYRRALDICHEENKKEEQIQQEKEKKNHAKNQSKGTKVKSKKVSSKSNKTAVEKI